MSWTKLTVVALVAVGLAGVTALITGVTKSMLITKIKSVLAVVLAVGMGIGLPTNSLAAERHGTGSSDAKKPDDREKLKPALQFEQVVLVRNKAPQVPSLYVLVPEVTKDLD